MKVQILSEFCFGIWRQRAQDMWNWIYQLESEKFDFIEHMKHQKYEVTAKWYDEENNRRTTYNVFLSHCIFVIYYHLLFYSPALSF